MAGIIAAPGDLLALKALPWTYNWGASLSANLTAAMLTAGMEFVPMQVAHLLPRHMHSEM